MRKKILGIMLFLAISTLGFGSVLLSVDDKIGDDNGPGTYIYPQNKAFVKNAFDLVKFKIEEDVEAYYFNFTIPVDFKNEWKLPNGWDVQMFDVYLNFGKGSHHQTIAGRNVKLKQGWDKALLVVGEKNEVIQKKEIENKNEEIFDSKSESENLINDIILPESFKIEKNVLKARVLKKQMNEMGKLKSIQVFLLGAEGFPLQTTTFMRRVLKNSTEWRFGGGADLEGGPNVIDILGDNTKLKNYAINEEREKSVFAEVDMISIKK